MASNMVLGHYIAELRKKMEEAGREVSQIDDFQGLAILELPTSSHTEFEFIQHNWPLLAYIIKTKDDIMRKDVEKVLPNKGLLSRSLQILRENEQALPDKEVLAQIIDVAGQVDEQSPGKNGQTHSLNIIRLDNNKKIILAHSDGSQVVQASEDSYLPGLHDDTSLDILARSCRSYYPILACVNRKFKELIYSGILYKLRRQLGIVEYWVFLSWVLMHWEAFDPVRRSWMKLPKMPCDVCFAHADKESLAVGTQLLVFGRELPAFAIWMYSLITREWSRGPPMNFPRCLFGSSSLGEIGIIAGGTDGEGNVLDCAELYNSETGTWHILPNMNSPRKMCSGFFMDGKFFVIGGMSNRTDGLTCGEEYDLETGTWRRIENMYPAPNMDTPSMPSPPLVAVVNNQLYLADQETNEVKRYDKINNSWTTVKILPLRADSSNGWGIAFRSCGPNLIVVGRHAGPNGTGIVIHSWRPDDPDAQEDWSVLSVRERAGTFVYNCAIMGC